MRSEETHAKGVVRRLLIQGMGLFSGATLSSLSLGITSLVVSRALGPTAFGTWGAALALALMSRAFLSFGSPEPLGFELAAARQKENAWHLRLALSATWWTDLTSAVLSLLVAVVGAYLVTGHSVVGRQALPLYWLAGAANACTAFYALWFTVAREQRRYRFIGLCTGAPGVVQALVIAVLYLTGRLSLFTVALTYCLTLGVLKGVVEAVSLIGTVRSVYRLPAWPLAPWVVWRHRHELDTFWRFLGASWVSLSVGGLSGTADAVCLSVWGHSAAEVGFYRLARQLAELANALSTSLGHAVYQDFVEMHARGETAAIRHRLRRLLIWAVPVAVAVVVVSSAAAVWVIPAVFGRAFSASVPLFALLMVGIGARLAAFPAVPLLSALRRYRFGLLCNVGLILPALALLPLLASHGAWVVAAAISLDVTVVYVAFTAGAFHYTRPSATGHEPAPDAEAAARADTNR